MAEYTNSECRLSFLYLCLSTNLPPGEDTARFSHTGRIFHASPNLCYTIPYLLLSLYFNSPCLWTSYKWNWTVVLFGLRFTPVVAFVVAVACIHNWFFFFFHFCPLFLMDIWVSRLRLLWKKPLWTFSNLPFDGYKHSLLLNTYPLVEFLCHRILLPLANIFFEVIISSYIPTSSVREFKYRFWIVLYVSVNFIQHVERLWLL